MMNKIIKIINNLKCIAPSEMGLQMKTYLEHLLESDREYHFRIKTIEKLDDELMVKLERILSKYELRDITGPSKTIVQNHPLDFYDISNAEVYIVDATLGVPQSSYILQQEIRAALGISENYVVVRGDNEPLEIETQRRMMDKDIRDEAEKKSFKKSSLLDTEEIYPESEHSIDGSTFYGNEYNSRFLNALAQVSASRKEGIEEPEEGLFDWLNHAIGDKDVLADDNTFNNDIEDAPRSVAWWNAKNKDVENKDLERKKAPQDNLDNDFEEKFTKFTDNKMNKKTLSAKSSSVRK